MRRITKAALGGLVGGVLVLSGTQTAIGDSVRQLFAGSVVDLADGLVPPTYLDKNTGAFE